MIAWYSMSGMFLISEMSFKSQATTVLTIVAALTNGDIDNLMVGTKRPIYDRMAMIMMQPSSKSLE
jgi:hypothetical protein